MDGLKLVAGGLRRIRIDFLRVRKDGIFFEFSEDTEDSQFTFSVFPQENEKDFLAGALWILIIKQWPVYVNDRGCLLFGGLKDANNGRTRTLFHIAKDGKIKTACARLSSNGQNGKTEIISAANLYFALKNMFIAFYNDEVQFMDRLAHGEQENTVFAEYFVFLKQKINSIRPKTTDLRLYI